MNMYFTCVHEHTFYMCSWICILHVFINMCSWTCINSCSWTPNSRIPNPVAFLMYLQESCIARDSLDIRGHRFRLSRRITADRPRFPFYTTYGQSVAWTLTSGIDSMGVMGNPLHHFGSLRISECDWRTTRQLHWPTGSSPTCSQQPAGGSHRTSLPDQRTRFPHQSKDSQGPVAPCRCRVKQI